MAERRSVKPKREEFKITDKDITHEPTRWSLSFYPNGSPANARLGHLGSVLPDGRDYRDDEVQTMAWQLWEENKRKK
jgi:hypothetical protein